MMTKRITAFIVAMIMLLCVLPVITAADERDYSGTYYTSNGYNVSTLLSQTGTTLFNNLQTLMTDTHTHITTYNEIRYLFVNSDADLSNSGNIILCYSGASVNGTWDSGTTFNREHVWPQSQGTFTTSNAGADLHHIRPENGTVNSTRSNYPAAWIDTATKELTYNNQGTQSYIHSTIGEFEPRDEFKGDMARIYFYVACRWGEDLTNPVEDDTFETLLEWNLLDPVDDWEMARNNYVQTLQGNRNVFIDYPEFGRLIYGTSTNGYNYTVLTDGDYTYYVKNGYATIVSYSGSATTLSIPTTLGGYTVNAIGCAAFANNSTLTTVTIPSCITTVGTYAFFNDTSLTTVYVGSGSKTFERRAFRDCANLKSMYFYGAAPSFEAEGSDQIMISGSDNGTAPSGFRMYYISGQSGWTSGTWTASNGTYAYSTSTWSGGSEPTTAPTGTTDPTPTPTPTPTATPTTGEGDYVLVTDIDEVTTGNYVLYGVNASYNGAMNSTVSGGHMGLTAVTVSGNTIVDPDETVIWYMEQQTDGSFTLYNAAAGVYCMISTNSTSGFSTGTTATYGYTITAANESEGSYYMQTTLSGSTRMISIYQKDFRPYNTSNWHDLYLYKYVEGEDPTPTPTATPTPTPTATPEPVYHTVTFVDWDGTVLSTQQVLDGASATAPSTPSRTGYTFTGWDSSYTNVTSDITVTAVYTVNSYTLTINYVYADGGTAASTYTRTLNYGAAYSVVSPAITGYTPDAAVVSGSMGADNVTVTVTYTANSYTLTINYVYADGGTAAASYTGTYTYGQSYSVASPVIEGYTADVETVSGTMGAGNVTSTVTYTANAVAGLLGDVDCNGSINFADVALLYQYVIGAAELTEQGLINANVDGAGEVTFADVSALYQLILIG